MTKAEKKILKDLWVKLINVRDKVCQRPNCPNCRNRNTGVNLQAHHIISSTNWALKYDPKNGILLCDSSHLFWAHVEEDEFKKTFQNKIDL